MISVEDRLLQTMSLAPVMHSRRQKFRTMISKKPNEVYIIILHLWVQNTSTISEILHNNRNNNNFNADSSFSEGKNIELTTSVVIRKLWNKFSAGQKVRVFSSFVISNLIVIDQNWLIGFSCFYQCSTGIRINCLMFKRFTLGLILY